MFLHAMSLSIHFVCASAKIYRATAGMMRYLDNFVYEYMFHFHLAPMVHGSRAIVARTVTQDRSRSSRRTNASRSCAALGSFAKTSSPSIASDGGVNTPSATA